MIYVVVMSAFLWALVCLYAKRLHDLGWSAIWCVVALFDLPVDIVLNLVSLVTPVYETAWNFSNGLSTIGNVTAMIMGLILTFRRGQRGPNRYGPDPLQPPQTDTSVF
ncbi:putative membrane protein [Asticcacaulis biprosthecium C19]|uniref:Putative membrane protein n=2 Tax=Asticcacaulis biprosthecium TaxID=76891 RepID=F4QL57_9CAUL|nr:putative membrane protein [Asticcacaulis biprosthecium C19]